MHLDADSALKSADFSTERLKLARRAAKNGSGERTGVKVAMLLVKRPRVGC
jgi:hypothetical protein